MGSVFAHYCKTKSPLWSGHAGWLITETVSRGYKRLFLSSMWLRIGESPYAGPSSPHVTAVKFPTLSPTPPDQSAKYKGSPTSIYFFLLTLYLFISSCALKNTAWHFEKKRGRDSLFILQETICSDMKAVLVHGSLRSLFSSTVWSRREPGCCQNHSQLSIEVG